VAALILGLSLLTAAAAMALSTPDRGKPQYARILPAPITAVPAAETKEEAADRPAAAQSAGGRPPKKAERAQMPNPRRIVIPAIGVDAPVISLGLNSDRTLEVPEDFSDTGWFRDGPEPGERGGAVIVGHVDSKSGPAVFYRLRALERGDLIKVVLEDRSTVRFAVHSTMAVPKNDFPTDLVYTESGRPALRLITCDGEFDESTGHYLDNYIVFARIVE